MRKTESIVLFGGSFDPIHNGHLTVAAYAFERLGADRLVFIPARRSPHKTVGPAADSEARLAMTRLAIEGHKSFEVSDCELHRPDPSYTLDTVGHFRKQVGPAVEIFWLIGADAIADLERWYHIDELLEMCRLCIMYRGGMPRPDLSRLIPAFGIARVRQLEDDILSTPLVKASSTDIRARLAAGKPVDNLVPPAVLDYICRQSLYTSVTL